MSTTFFISDTHFGHANILKFTEDDDSLIRPGFGCVEEMNEHMIKCWNSVVGPQDKVIHCGDVAFGKEALNLCHRLKGIKYLVMGNHDNYDIHSYLDIFHKLHGVKYIGRNEAICTHVPIHNTSLRDFKVNIHGHLHTSEINDPRYFNVSVEQIDYTPISLDEIKEIVANR